MKTHLFKRYTNFLLVATLCLVAASTSTSVHAGLAEALNTTNIIWSTSGAGKPWFVETTNTFDGTAAAQSGSVTNVQTSILTGTVYGPGKLSFYWASQAIGNNFDYEFDIDGAYVDDIYGNTPWAQESTNTLSAGPHTLTWTTYAYTDNEPTAAGFLDKVSYVEALGTPLTLTNVTYTGTNLSFSFTAQAGITNIVQYTTNLTTGNWRVYSNIFGSPGLTTVSMPLSLFGTSKTGFVRVHP